MNISEEVRPILAGQRQITRAVSVWLSRLQARLDHLGASWASRRQRARQVQELYRASDRELWDMGLSRSDLPAIARGTHRRD
jgi:uncharacterized protein YjiS (DUF1127 family)